MAFDKTQFIARLRAALVAAANPAFVPVPDEQIADEAERERLHQAALQRAAAGRVSAMLDVLCHDLAYMVARASSTLVDDARAALYASAVAIAGSTTDEVAAAEVQRALMAAVGIESTPSAKE